MVRGFIRVPRRELILSIISIKRKNIWYDSETGGGEWFEGFGLRIFEELGRDEEYTMEG